MLQTADGAQRQSAARILVNAAGPWIAELRKAIVGDAGPESLRLVKGSHLVVPRLYAGEQAYLLQNDDGRIAFVIPFEDDFSLVGTTEVPLDAPEAAPQIDAAETDYLCSVVGRFFQAPPDPSRAVWSYAGIRALYDDGQGNASAVSREYRMTVDGSAKEAPLLSIYGGKLTTYRHLAERVLARLQPWLPDLRPPWSAAVHLPGGGLGPRGLPGLLLELAGKYPALPPDLLHALARRHGTRAARVLGAAQTEADLGEHFGGGLYAAEVDYMAAHEWAHEVDDVLWRRTKCGLRIDATGRARLARHLDEKRQTA